MDTKWKKSKKVISFILFFLGVSMTLGSIVNICRDKPSSTRIWQVDKLLEEDYQQSRRFRDYIANRLENFLIMATGGEGLGGIWGYSDGAYYGRDYYDDYYYDDYYYDDFIYEEYGFDSSSPSEMTDPIKAAETQELSEDTGISSSLSRPDPEIYLYGLRDLSETILEILDSFEDIENLDSWETELYREQLEECQDIFREYLAMLETDLSRANMDIKPLTEEQKRKIAQKYHDIIKGDKNLLYTVAYDGQVLYSNSDQLPADGSMTAPDGYNFILYFDGEKVRILKDGKELDIYGDGYYREDSEWYVPGYSNFQTDETAQKAVICIAAAREPLLYMNGAYGSGGSMQYDNSLYWMNYNLRARRDSMSVYFACLAAGIMLLAAAFLCRRSRREALDGIARFQSKIWAEFKMLLFLIVLYVLYLSLTCTTVYSDYSLWREITYAYGYENSFEVFSLLVQELTAMISPLFWLILFWSIYLLWNDLRHNKKIWRHSLTAKLCAFYSTKGMEQTVSRKTAHRNRLAFTACVLYGLLMLGSILIMNAARLWSQGILLVFGILPVFDILATIGFLILQTGIGKKNMETARDVESLSIRIGEIRSGNYKISRPGSNIDGSGTEPAGEFLDPEKNSDVQGHDLENMMAQLEDISHGMANAVDEQMKSERMKVELIANVSHDIKTPLTSIISYVEFLKQEEDLPDYVKDYIRILDEKSQRLKNMVQDVFAVSKAASGELPMQMEALDFGKLLRQTLADMEEQINVSAVAFRTQIPDAPVMILADGQRMYRVFQNLFQNAIQYSLDGSRVYVTLKTEGTLAVASIKNTSHQELEKGRDFAERFARGDSSRTDGGSGLGLSIAQSFTEACGGKFFWETDADLFVVKISFWTI